MTGGLIAERNRYGLVVRRQEKELGSMSTDWPWSWSPFGGSACSVLSWLLLFRFNNEFYVVNLQRLNRICFKCRCYLWHSYQKRRVNENQREKGGHRKPQEVKWPDSGLTVFGDKWKDPYKVKSCSCCRYRHPFPPPEWQISSCWE